MTHLYVGIDGGQTGTACVALNRAGEVLGQGYAGSVIDLMHPKGGLEHMRSALALALSAALQQAGGSAADVQAAYLSLTGGLDWARGVMSELLPTTLTLVEADIINALYCGTLGRPGVGLISGTGAVAYLRDGAGREQVSGGWGYLFGDEGSGQWIALEVVRACAKVSDGLLPDTSLHSRVLELYPGYSLRDIVGGVYSAALPRTALAALAPLALSAAQQGDPVAQDIVRRAAIALMGLLTSVSRDHQLEPENQIIVGSGGPLYPGSVLWNALLRLIQRELPSFRLQAPELPPVLAAGYRSFELAGLPRSEQALTRLQAQVSSLPTKSLLEVSHAR